MFGKPRRAGEISIAGGGRRVLNRGMCADRFACGGAVRAVREVAVLNAVRQRVAMPLRGRSYMAFALSPQPPIAEWLAELDASLAGAEGFFNGRPVVLDLSAVTLTSSAIAHLLSELATRGIRIMGLEGIAADAAGPHLPPVVNGGRPAPVEAVAARAAAQPAAAATLFVDHPVRSGETVFHPGGDVTVLGSVGSGAEVMAGGSIHVYGTLRGRAMAGTSGDRSARIYCLRLEAELLAIDGYYRTAEHLGGDMRGRAVQAWLTEETLNIAALETEKGGWR